MKIFLGQIKTTPGDFAGNVSTILRGLSTISFGDGISLAVFPELSICGYLSRDLLFNQHYIEQNLRGLQCIVDASKADNLHDVNIVVGYVDENRKGVGKPFRNMLAVIRNGAIIGTYQKHLICFYDVFDEGRYFEPGNELLVLTIDGRKFGFTICEDIWNDKDVVDYSYTDNPIESYRKLGVGNIVNISSSPFVLGKPRKRMAMLENVYGSCPIHGQKTLIYVNQIGGQDDLVFDGHSCIIHGGYIKTIISNTKKIVSEQFEKVDLEMKVGMWVPSSIDESPAWHHHRMIVSALYDYVTKSGFKKIVLGSSGGIDSAVVAALACEAFGPENVHCIMMPSVYSSPGSVNDAKELHKNLGCHEYHLPIEHLKMITHFTENLKIDTYHPSADENLQARLRGLAVMWVSNGTGALALTTGNKTELATGYFTLYGDANGGFAPINDLYKMQVYALARHINEESKKEVIPKSIIDKAPSAELAPGQTDEASLLPYPILDEIVRLYIEQHVDTFESLLAKSGELVFGQRIESEVISNWAKADYQKAESEFNRIVRLINLNEFKRRQCAIGPKLSKVAFGTGRRLPIVKKI